MPNCKVITTNSCMMRAIMLDCNCSYGHGNSSWVTVNPDEAAEPIAVLLIQWDGKVIESQRAPVKGLLELYIANTRNWSGGGCWRGVAIGREGALLALGCSGSWEYYEVVGGQWVKSRPPAAQ